MIFDIKRYTIHDGPGIRITLFLKGCPLSCLWCHNPEGISAKPQKLYSPQKCLGCGSCITVCPQKALSLTACGVVTDPSRCTCCGLCTHECPTLAMELSGQSYTTDALMEEIQKEKLFMDQSGGGVTFCGGEPLMQADWLTELLIRCGKEGIHRAVDSSLYASPRQVKQVMAHTDLFLVDLKVMDSDKHQRYCGQPNELILANLRMISEAGCPYMIRIPLIEGVNADDDNIRQTAHFLASLPQKPVAVQLLPYHDSGKNKHEKLGSRYNPHQLLMTIPSQERLQHCLSLLHTYHIEAQVGG